MNEYFRPVGVGIDPDNFEMKIFDRWGDLIFSTNDYKEGWDGRVIRQSKHDMKRTLKFIEDDYQMRDGRVFAEFSPMCFNLINENGTLSNDADELKVNAIDFYNIVQ
ncbi:MAG: gliding motility-associated C-terminal domain-containing protein, partial [Nitrospinae bacterium]|nr:gliding motility-associated C-terminal domain-containing protein [Nitrospinota bacterium]